MINIVCVLKGKNYTTSTCDEIRLMDLKGRNSVRNKGVHCSLVVWLTSFDSSLTLKVNTSSVFCEVEVEFHPS